MSTISATKAQHTPGPWVQHGAIVPRLIQATGTGHIIAETLATVAPAEEMANARLIAAAPELLAAVRHARSLLTMPKGTVTEKALRATCDRIDLAIAKATGSEALKGGAL